MFVLRYLSVAFENHSHTALKTLKSFVAAWPDRRFSSGANGLVPPGRPLLWGGAAATLTLAAVLIAIRAPGDSLPDFWPAAGVATGFVLATQNLKRWASALGVLLAVPLARAVQGEWLFMPALFLTASLAQAIVIAFILERIGGKPFTLDRVRNVGAFFLVVIAVAAAMGLAVGVGLAWTAFTHDPFAKIWWAYTSANVVGVVTVAPALLLLRLRAALKSKGLTEDIAFALAVAATSIAVIGGAVPKMSLAMLLALVLAGPLALWAILRATASRAAIGLVIISLLTIWAAGTRGLFADNLVAAQIFLFAASALLLFLGARREAQQMEHPSWLRLPETADQRIAVIIVPLVLFGTMAWWNWRNVEQTAVQHVERITTAVEEHAQRVFDIQEAVLTSALARVRGLTPMAIPDTGDVHKFLFDLAHVSNSILLIADGTTGRVLAASTKGPRAEQTLSAEEYTEADGEGTSSHVGQVGNIKPTGEAGFSMSRRDGASGLVAVSLLPVNKFLSLYASPNASEHDALMVIRADGAALVMQPATYQLIGFQLPKNSFFMRWQRGKFKRPHLASCAIDGRERLWQVKKLDGYPVYAVYGYDASNLHTEWLLRVVPFGVLALLASGTLALLVSRIRRGAAETERANAEAANQRALAAMSDRLRLALNSASAGAWDWEVGAPHVVWSKETFALFGVDQAEGDLPFPELFERCIHPEDRSKLTEQFTAVLDGTSSTFTVDYRVIHPQRGIRWLSARGRVERGADGKPRRLAGLNFDVTAQKEAEIRLAEREVQLRLFVENAPAAIAMFDKKMRYMAVSRRFLEDNGLPRDHDPAGRLHYEVCPEVPQRWREIHARVLSGEELSHDEDQLQRQDGRIDWLRWSMKPWRTPGGEVGGALLFKEVITEQVEARRRIAASEARFRATFENAAVGFAHVGTDGTWLLVNNRLCDTLGYSPEELLTKKFQDVTHPEDLEANLVQVDRILKGEVPSYALEKRYLRKDGSTIWVRVTVGALRKSDGAIEHLISVVEDISEHKHAQERLGESEGRFRGIFEHAVTGIAIKDLEGHFQSCNPAYTAMLGYSEAELRDLCCEDLMHPDEYVANTVQQERLVTGKIASYDLVTRYFRKDGKILWGHRHLSLLRDAAGQPTNIIALVTDITDRKLHEEQVNLLLREVNHRSKNMLALVLAVARQTASSKPEDFIRRFEERIQALAASQNLLVKNEWRGVEIQELIRSQLAHFKDLIGTRVLLRGPSLSISASAAQTLGMALHELATNAGKYGALSNECGHVELRWDVERGSGSSRTFSICWCESSGPSVMAPRRQGFGSTVIGVITKASLDAEVDLDYAPGGLSWRLECPLEEVEGASGSHCPPELRISSSEEFYELEHFHVNWSCEGICKAHEH